MANFMMLLKQQYLYQVYFKSNILIIILFLKVHYYQLYKQKN